MSDHFETRQKFINLAEAIRVLPFSADVRNAVAEATGDALDAEGNEHFNRERFVAHATSDTDEAPRFDGTNWVRENDEGETVVVYQRPVPAEETDEADATV